MNATKTIKAIKHAEWSEDFGRCAVIVAVMDDKTEISLWHGFATLLSDDMAKFSEKFIGRSVESAKISLGRKYRVLRRMQSK